MMIDRSSNNAPLPVYLGERVLLYQVVVIMFRWGFNSDASNSSTTSDYDDDDGDRQVYGEGRRHRYNNNNVGETKYHGGGGGGGGTDNRRHGGRAAKNAKHDSKTKTVAPLLDDLDHAVTAAILTQVRGRCTAATSSIAQ